MSPPNKFMAKENYVNLDAVREALEQVVKNAKEIKEVLDLLAVNTVQVDEAKPVEPTAPAEDDGDEGAPRPKQQFVILVSDPDKIINKDLTGWVLQIPEDEDVQEVVANIKKGAYNFNASKKGSKYPVSSIGQAIGEVGSKFFKPYSIKIKTKEPAYILTTDNKLPKS